MSSKRILILSLSYYPLIGGAETAIKDITSRLKDVQFDMVTLRFSPDHKEFEFIGNVHVHRIGGGSGSYLSKIFFVPRAAWKAWQLHKKNRYHKFWAIMSYMSFPIALMRMFGNSTPYVLTLQDGDPFERVFKRFRIRIFLPLLRKGFRDAQVVQTISNFLADWAKKSGYQGRIEIIPNGVDYKKFGGEHAKYEGNIILITTSRLVEKNGVGDVVEALKFLPEEVKFKIIGNGPLIGKLTKRVQELKLTHRVKFVGFLPQDEIPPHLHASHIFIRPSLSEGMGSSFIEAMAAGLPVIATPVGGIPDFLSDPDRNREKHPTGLFVNVHDPKDITRQAQRLIKDKKLRETLVTNAKRMVKEKYDWDLITDQMKTRVFDVR